MFVYTIKFISATIILNCYVKSIKNKNKFVGVFLALPTPSSMLFLTLQTSKFLTYTIFLLSKELLLISPAR